MLLESLPFLVQRGADVQIATLLKRMDPAFESGAAMRFTTGEHALPRCSSAALVSRRTRRWNSTLVGRILHETAGLLLPAKLVANGLYRCRASHGHRCLDHDAGPLEESPPASDRARRINATLFRFAAL